MIEKGDSRCDPAKWLNTRRMEIGLPTRSADGLRNTWPVQAAWGLKATDCVQLTAHDAAGNASDPSDPVLVHLDRKPPGKAK